MKWLMQQCQEWLWPLRVVLEWFCTLLGGEDYTFLGEKIYDQAIEHLLLVIFAVLIACAVAVPVGIALARCRLRAVNLVVMGTANVIQTIPSLALIAFILLLFYSLRFLGLRVTGPQPAMTALVLYALLPILRNTFTGIRQVDPAVIEVATGMGMTRLQILFKVELPLALPVIMAGIRIATVWTIGCAALCFLIGGGGLGKLIIQGINGMSYPRLLAGTVPAALMALVFDWGLGLLEWRLTPDGMRQNAVS